MLALGGWGRFALWNVAEPARPRPLSTVVGVMTVSGLVFSPDSGLLAVASSAGVAGVELYRIGDPRRPRRLTEFDRRIGGVTALAFGADGRALVAGGADERVRLWDVAEPARPRLRAALPVGAVPGSVALRWSGGGRVLAAVDGRSVRVWELDMAAAREQVCARVGTRITRAEWLRYLPDRSFRAPCP
jgi:WD40 repeat protein